MFAPKTLEELASRRRSLPAKPPSIIAVHGGDGTLHRTVAALGLAFGEAPIPPLAILGGGTMNVVSASLGSARRRCHFSRRSWRRSGPTSRRDRAAALPADRRHAGVHLRQRADGELSRRVLRDRGVRARPRDLAAPARARFGDDRRALSSTSSSASRGRRGRRPDRSSGPSSSGSARRPFARSALASSSTIAPTTTSNDSGCWPSTDVPRPHARLSGRPPGRGVSPKRAFSAVASTIKSPRGRQHGLHHRRGSVQGEGSLTISVGPHIHFVQLPAPSALAGAPRSRRSPQPGRHP